MERKEDRRGEGAEITHARGFTYTALRSFCFSLRLARFVPFSSSWAISDQAFQRTLGTDGLEL